MTATKLMKTRMNVPPRVLGKCSFASRAMASPLPEDKKEVGAKKKIKRPCLANDSRKNTRLDCADCCICVAVEGGQMHEDAGVAESWPMRRWKARNEKGRCWIAAHDVSSSGETTDKPSCIKTVQFSSWYALHAKFEGNVTRDEMLVNCCLNDAHDSTMTDDRANPRFGRQPGEGAQSLAWRGIRRIAAVWKGGLKVAGNGLVGEFLPTLESGERCTWKPVIWRLEAGRKCGVPSGERRNENLLYRAANGVVKQAKKIRARGADFSSGGAGSACQTWLVARESAYSAAGGT